MVPVAGILLQGFLWLITHGHFTDFLEHHSTGFLQLAIDRLYMAFNRVSLTVIEKGLLPWHSRFSQLAFVQVFLFSHNSIQVSLYSIFTFGSFNYNLKRLISYLLVHKVSKCRLPAHRYFWFVYNQRRQFDNLFHYFYRTVFPLFSRLLFCLGISKLSPKDRHFIYTE
jgi:hypothetical protein